jgi:hypothetical protein
MEKNNSGLSPFNQIFKFLKPAPRSMKSRAPRKAAIVKSVVKAPKPVNRKKSATVKTSPYQAAGITSNNSNCACEAVKQIEGIRFLAREAPILPLQDCTSPQCTCSYARYRDRRGFNGDRRAIASQRQGQRSGKVDNNRTLHDGRRTSDGDGT